MQNLTYFFQLTPYDYTMLEFILEQVSRISSDPSVKKVCILSRIGATELSVDVHTLLTSL